MNELKEVLEPVQRINRDMMTALRTGATISTNEARMLVDLYYQMQRNRVRTSNQDQAEERAAKKAQVEPEPHDVLKWMAEQQELLEKQVPKVMQIFVSRHSMGWFFEQTIGIGPVLAAGLLAHLDIEKAPTVGHFWRFAGLDPTVKWEKGQKRPWNGRLKVLCWKLGDSFVKHSGRDNCFYGKLYRARKAIEVVKNNGSLFAEQAKAMLERWPNHKQKEIYQAGKLPDGQLDMRARRWAVKMMLSHLHECWFRVHYGKEPPACFALAHMQHTDYLPPPQARP